MPLEGVGWGVWGRAVVHHLPSTGGCTREADGDRGVLGSLCHVPTKKQMMIARRVLCFEERVLPEQKKNQHGNAVTSPFRVCLPGPSENRHRPPQPAPGGRRREAVREPHGELRAWWRGRSAAGRGRTGAHPPEAPRRPSWRPRTASKTAKKKTPR